MPSARTDSGRCFALALLALLASLVPAGPAGAADCATYTLYSTSNHVSYLPGSLDANLVGAPSGCQHPWTATSNDPSWLSVTPVSGNASATLHVSWLANAGAERTGTVTVRGEYFNPPMTLTVYQGSGSSAVPCTSFSLSPSSATPATDAGSQAVSVVGSPSGCSAGSWTASSGASWITVSTGSGYGPGGVTVSWTKNTGAARSGTASIAGKTFTVNQAGAGVATLTIPSSASIHGSGGAFFHSDLWAMNRSYTNVLTVTARLRCLTGQSCGSGTRSFQLAPRQSILYPDVVAGLFLSPERAGAIELTYDAALGQLSASSRVYTPSLPAPTNGTTVPALAASEARTRALFLGLGANGGDLASGFRSNAGAYNPNASAVSVTFTLYNGATGAVLGAPLTRTWAANEAYQFNDIFAFVGAGSSVTTNAYLVVTSALPIFPFVTVIDNKSGDSVWGTAGSDEAR